MRLYYLTQLKYAERILEEKRFKLSTVPEANDPFELMGAWVGERRARHLYQVLHTHLCETIGMLCTSRTWESPVMWAHYGDKHKGVCLGFDVDDAEACQVKYEPRRLSGLLDHIGRGQLLNEQQMRAVLTTKFKDWAYEREWRIFAGLSDREPESGLYFLDFAPHFTLREVILGHRCTADVEHLAQFVGRPRKSVEVFRARPAFQSFRIVRRRDARSISLMP
ncbi:hypothetical protein QF000_006654 [Paraburkholderia atlantica]|uniref:DUF2971 domain-containing protein n=1 Tax=Paraburkholderia atlantica TaxID=2654982 RepID=UPI003D2188AD